MLTLPPFEYHSPHSVNEAVALLARHRGNVKVIAGGTDLMPNMKHRLFTPAYVVGLRAIPELHQLREENGVLRIGSMVTLAKLASDPLVKSRLPSLADAANHVAGPQLREMGTVGGNLCLDTRCVYYNQTYFWRQALGFCLKKDGTVCHVVKAGRKCVAAASNDTAPVMLTLDARIHVAGPDGSRELPVGSFYVPDGIINTVLQPDDVVTEIRIPLPDASVRMGYEKLRLRAAIDYPALTVAVAAKVSGAEKKIDWVRVVISALGARPHVLARLESFAGRALDDAAV
ncbi:MAG: FAD binding domain-containing protein [Myxococcaceae bacterium]